MNVTPPGKWIGIVSTTVESASPQADLMAGLKALGPVDEMFMEVVDVREPRESGDRDRCFISRGYDATSHFESTMTDVMDLYYRVTGKPLVFRDGPPAPGEQSHAHAQARRAAEAQAQKIEVPDGTHQLPPREASPPAPPPPPKEPEMEVAVAVETTGAGDGNQPEEQT